VSKLKAFVLFGVFLVLYWFNDNPLNFDTILQPWLGQTGYYLMEGLFFGGLTTVFYLRGRIK
jgi:hypothetical protein